MAGIRHRVGIKAPLSRVYEALSTVEGIQKWWTKEATGNLNTGNTIDVRFLSPDGNEVGRMCFELMVLQPNKKIRWQFKSGPDEWLETNVTYTLSQEGEYTIILFNHENWSEPVEFMAHCSMKWATFLLSLKSFIETGIGSPSPDDLKIDNWN